MAVAKWRGDAQPVAQVTTLTVGGTAANGQIYTATINRKEVAYTANGSDTNATIAAALAAALAASTLAEFQEATWTHPGSGAVITGTAATAGVPFTVTGGATGTGSLTPSTTTASKGPNHVDDVDNWSTGALPVDATDSIVIEGNVGSLLYGLTALAAVEPTSFTVRASFTGRIGLPDRNQSGYAEYRDLALVLDDNPPVTIGDGEGDGSDLIRLAVGEGSSAIVVRKTGRRPNDAPAALILTTSSGNNTLAVFSGDVAVAPLAGQTAEFATVTCGAGDSATADAPTVLLGSGTTVATSATVNAGTLTSFTTIPQLYQQSGTHVQAGGTLTNVRNDGGTTIYKSTGTTTLGTFRGPNARCDCRQDSRARTFTDSEFTGGAALLDPAETIAFTNPATFDRESLLASDIGRRFTLDRA